MLHNEYNMNINWISPKICDPPHGVKRQWQADEFTEKFSKEGWDRTKPALIGYPLHGRIQLLSGSHRFAGAVRSELSYIPVIIKPLKDVQDAFGHLDKWRKIMRL